MPDQDAPQERIDQNAFDEFAEFLVETELEKTRIFRDLAKAGTMVTAYFAGGSNFILTTLLHVDTDRGLLVFEPGPDKERTAQLLASGRLTGVTTHNHVKVQFVCESLQRCSYQGEEALCSAFPSRMLRLQRRDTFRQTVPVGMRIKCELHTRTDQLHDLLLVDISSGGICVADETAQIDLQPTTIIPECKILLPEHGTIEARLEVRNRYVVTLKTGREVQRFGCQFVHLPSRMNSVVQRFIISIDRERRRLDTRG